LFAKSDTQLDVLLCTVHIFSHDFCLSSGLYKCAKCSVTRGKVVTSGDVSLSDGSTICQLDVGEIYKYLGFYEAERVDYVKSKKVIYGII